MAADPEVLPNELIRAVELLADILASNSARYAMVGGLATLLRGRPRFTQDVDLLLDISQLALPGLLDKLTEQGFTLDPSTVIREYVRENFTAFRFGLIRVDCIKPVLPLYSRAIANATELTWTEGHSVRVAMPEGLILTKMVAFRSQDQVDIETLLVANRDDLDVDMIRREWAAVAEGEDARSRWLEEMIARHIPHQP